MIGKLSFNPLLDLVKDHSVQVLIVSGSVNAQCGQEPGPKSSQPLLLSDVYKGLEGVGVDLSLKLGRVETSVLDPHPCHIPGVSQSAPH